MVSSGPIAGGLHKVPWAIGESATQTDKNPPSHTHTHTHTHRCCGCSLIKRWCGHRFHFTPSCCVVALYSRHSLVRHQLKVALTRIKQKSPLIFWCLNVTFFLQGHFQNCLNVRESTFLGKSWVCDGAVSLVEETFRQHDMYLSFLF